MHSVSYYKYQAAASRWSLVAELAWSQGAALPMSSLWSPEKSPYS